MKSVFYLKTCSTCTKILKQFDLSEWQLREIKSEPITAKELEEMYRLAGSYEALFSKKSSQIKLQDIDVKTLQEEDFRNLLLQHYTFLKRPVFLTDREIFIGNDKKNLEKLNAFFLADLTN